MLYLYIQNLRGDVVMLVWSNGDVASIRDYDASGQMLCLAPRDRDPFGFTGGLDAGNGLWKLGAGFYDSGKNAFIQQDRYLGDPNDPLSLNRYVYCELDPVNYVDPSGLFRGNDYGLPSEFWNWYHRQVKKPGDPDLTKEKAEDLYQDWKDEGKPNAEGKPTIKTKEKKNNESESGSTSLDQKSSITQKQAETGFWVTVGAALVWFFKEVCEVAKEVAPAL